MKVSTTEIYAVSLIFVLLLGLLLPATQSSNHPRPTVQLALNILFPLDYSLRKFGFRDPVRIPVNIVTMVLWGLSTGFVLTRVLPTKNHS
jgi:hypothetical protein